MIRLRQELEFFDRRKYTQPITHTMIRNFCRKYSSNPIAQFNIFQPSLSQKLIKQVGNFGVTVNNTIYRGPIAIIDNHVFLSNVKQFGLPQTTENPEKTQLIDDPNSIFYQWNTEPLEVFTVADPKPDILVIGTGSKLFQLPKILKDYLLSHDIQVEVQKTVKNEYADIFNGWLFISDRLLQRLMCLLRKGEGVHCCYYQRSQHLVLLEKCS